MQTALPAHLGSTSAGSTTRALPGRIAIAVAATAIVALCAHISLPLPFTPVPLTLQPFAVILIGLVLGPVAGFSAMMLYLAEGAAGLPVFTPQGPVGLAHLLGPTAGFLFSYPMAAAAAGTLARHSTTARTRFASALAGGAVAALLIYAMGAGWLAHILHLAPRAAFTLAVLPFLPGEVIKIVLAAALFSMLRPMRSNDRGVNS